MSPAKILWIQAILILILASPMSAEESAEIMADTASDVATDVGEAASDVATDVGEAASDVADAAADGVDALGEAGTEALDEASDWAEETGETVGESAEDLADATLPADAAPAAMAPAEETLPGSSLGAVGYDSEGRQGRIHIVVKRDTLWDISNAYLGTPWVWPSIWNDNGAIENPHVIYPGDRIWITPSEMRKLTPEEAEAFLAGGPSMPAAQEEVDFEPAPSAPLVADPIERGSMRIAGREVVGLITAEQLEASASIVARVPERVLLSQEDDVFVGLGEADVDAGDQLTAFRTHEKVFDPDTGVLLGYHVEFLGWLEVEETFPETARAEIKMSTGEVEEGDRVIPREPIPDEIALQESPEDVEGKISFFPKKRVLMGFSDFVYLNRGTVDGLEVGAPLEVYRPGFGANETVREERVHVPDQVIAQLLVVRSDSQSSVAMVTHASTELELGDRFRGPAE